MYVSCTLTVYAIVALWKHKLIGRSLYDWQVLMTSIIYILYITKAISKYGKYVTSIICFVCKWDAFCLFFFRKKWWACSFLFNVPRALPVSDHYEHIPTSNTHHVTSYWWLVRVTLVVAFGFLPQNFGRWWGPTSGNFFVCECSLNSYYTHR